MCLAASGAPVAVKLNREWVNKDNFPVYTYIAYMSFG
jgi:hypothetical protein